MQAQRRSKGIAVLLILNLGIRWGQVVNAMPWLLYTQERAPVPIVQEDVWTPGTLWINVEKRKSLAPTRVQTPNHPACSKSLYYVMWPLIQL